MTENRRYAGAVVPRRLAAYGIDLAAVLILAGGGYLLTQGYLLSIVLAVEVLIVQVAWEARTGCTLGQWLLGLRTVQLGELRAPGLRRAVLRGLILLAGHLVAVGQIVMLASSGWDRSGHRQGWHDKVTGVRVIDLHRAAAATTRSRFAPGTQGGQGEPALVGAGAPVDASAAGQWSPPPMPAGSAPMGAPAAHGHQHQPYAGHPYAAQARPPQGYAPGPGIPSPQTAVGPGPVPQGPVQHAPVPPPPVPPPASEVPEATQSGTSALDFTYAEPPEGFAEAVRSARAEREAEEAAAQQQPAPGEQSPADQPSHRAPSAASPEEDVPDETQVPALRGLLLENGETVNVLGGGYIGRAPRSPDEDADAQLVAVPDPERSLSRTHARFGLVGGDLWLEDLGSANGTTVQMADGRQAHLTPHQRVALPVGTVVLLGTRRVTVTDGSDHTS